MRIPTNRSVQTTTSAVTTSNGTPIDVRRAKVFSCQILPTDNTATAKTFAPSAVDVTANSITTAANTYVTGVKGQFTTATTLPAGLSLLTDYYLIVISATVFKVATSLANAQAGTVVDITTQGTGNHTFTPTAIAGATAILQKSNDYNIDQATGTWDNISTATAMTVGTHYWLTAVDPEYAFVRVQLAVTAGMLNVTNNIIVKEDK